MNFPPNDPSLARAVTSDALFGGRLKLAQPANGHRAGTDAVLLAATAPLVSGLVIDVGAGVGTVGLAIALANPAARVCLLERDPAIAALARANVEANGMGGRVNVAEANLLAPFVRRNAGVKNESADLVVTNPPFYDARRSRAPAEPSKRDAHVFDSGDLGDWLRASATLLKPGGVLCLVHRADALAPILAALAGRTGKIVVRPIHARNDDRPATRVLVQATKGSRAPLELLPPLVLHNNAGGFGPEVAAMHEGRWLQTSDAGFTQPAQLPG